jgi:DNA-binding transcriptional LysR family regulator
VKHLQTLRLIQDVARAGSIRKAAEDLNITSSALNRRIQAFEAEFGAQIFERLPRGVRLNPAGELLMHHIRSQIGDLERVRSQVADLSGARRGHVSIACSQALNPIFLPAQIARYRAEHPSVTFTVRVRDRAAAERELVTFASDLALVFEPVHLVDFEVIRAIAQPVCAVMVADHPLAARPGPLRLRDCLDVPHVVPSHEYGVRHLLDQATRNRSRRLNPVVEADSFEMMRQYVLHERVLSFQIPIGLRPATDPRLVIREIDQRDLPAGLLLLGQMRGRTLPVATARFALQLSAALAEREAELAPALTIQS